MNLYINGFAGVFMWAFIIMNAKAQTLIEFDNQRFFAIDNGEKMFGFYNARHPKQFTPHFSCTFFFVSKQKSDNRYQLSTFYTDSSYENSDMDSDIDGNLIIKDQKWILHTDEFHGGCASGVGENFIAHENDAFPASFSAIKKSKALAINLASKKTFFLKIKSGHEYASSPSYLTKGDVVVVASKNEGYSFVQFSNPENSRITKGWIKNADLINPFPKD